jgi:hypothetical protein
VVCHVRQLRLTMSTPKQHLLPPDMTLKIFALAKARGLNVRQLTPEQYRQLALDIRSVKQKVLDGITAVESRVATNNVVGWRVVPLNVYEERKAKCESNTCGSFGQLADALPVCHACNCSDKFLDSKWRDSKQRCPKGHWDRHKPSEGA